MMSENCKENDLIFLKIQIKKGLWKVLNYENVVFKIGTVWAWGMMAWWVKDLAYDCEGWTWSLWHRIWANVMAPCNSSSWEEDRSLQAGQQNWGIAKLHVQQETLPQ